jgi:hypothetical protein
MKSRMKKKQITKSGKLNYTTIAFFDLEFWPDH